jgi:hypothetical protein
MAEALEREVWRYAKREYPEFVGKQFRSDADILISFFGDVSPSSINRVMSFQGSLYRGFALHTRICDIYSGCFEVAFDVGGESGARRVMELAEEGSLDYLAYSHKIIFIEALKINNIDKIHYKRDSLYRD